MYKTEIYITKDQSRFLYDLSYVESRRSGKRVSIAQLVRNAIDVLMKGKGSAVHKETKAILSNPQFLKDIKLAQKELAAGEYSTNTEEVFGDE